ncbi:MAG: glycosyltransferase [Bacilli bacterium]|nr:glycosyltransferase [Bacilli bacterium]
MSDISIIVPAYNAEKYIEKCLNSLIHQTKKELEFIIINDGSTDNTETVIKTFKDKRIKYFKNKNQGIGKTRNFGIEKANSKYVMFLDSDDYLDKHACEKMYQKAESDSLDVVICDFYKEYSNGTIEEIKTPFFENTSLKENPDIITEYLCPWAKLYTRKLIMDNQIRFPEKLKYEDAPFVIEALVGAEKIGKVDECLNYYLIHGNSETTVRDRRCFDIIKIIDRIRNFTKDKDYLKDKIDKLTVRILTNYTIQQRVQEDKRIGMEFIEEAFDYLEKEVPDYKNNKYYQGRGFLKRTIEKNKTLTKLYCSLYRR